MLNVLDEFKCAQEENYWKWIQPKNGVFSVNPTYSLLVKLLVWEERCSNGEKTVLSYLWKSLSPSRVMAFIFEHLSGRIPT